VEVLRGPQGTLYGRNASAGVINVVTNKPEFISEGRAGVTFGDYNHMSSNLISGGAAGDSNVWAYRTALEFTKSDGYFTQKSTGKEDVDEVQNFNGTVKLRRAPVNSDWDITTTLAMTQIRNGNTSFNSLANIEADNHTVNSDMVGHSDADLYSAMVQASYDGDNIDFQSLTSYGYEDKDEYNDLDFGDSDYYAMTLRIKNKQLKLAQEFRWSAKEDERLRWLGGLYFQQENYDSNIKMPGSVYMPGNDSWFNWNDHFDAKTETRSTAAFGNLSYDLTEKMVLLAGLRVDYEHIDYSYVGSSVNYGDSDFDKSSSYTQLQPKIGANYHAYDDLMYYASISRGYKSGGYYINAPKEEYSKYDPEFTMNYEIGMKSEWLDNTLLFNTSVYWIDWTDQQVEVEVYPYAYVENAASTVSRGIEAELNWYPAYGLQFFVNGAYTDAYYKDYTSGGEDFSGNTPSNAPEYTYSFGVNYSFMDNYFIYADYNATGESYFDAENTQKQDAYGLVNLRLGYDNGGLDATLWVKNLFDEEYLTRAIYYSDSKTWYGRSGDPRTFGVTLNYKW